ncbi:hypothetical protein [Pyrinomonas methylaliphatogenes]|uniref:Uncharacterized protein n=1 Tax=Pyrinomonas methylaliphatogenes TaxID=454194 RepID=A0A0B6WT13_9BACT|nr:hypothetical protein [Pyrinomonas methylaliphatogenes]CDM64368.1 hypothetical protein PYK22_00361 [Pyrinomonas methylaliphatogenes]
MFRRSDADRDRKLNQAGRQLLQTVAALNEAEAEEAAATPFLFARVRARIEQKRAEENGLIFLRVLYRVVPTMALATILALLFLWLGTDSRLTSRSSNEDLLLSINDVGAERIIYIDRRSITNDEVLANILSREERAEALNENSK